MPMDWNEIARWLAGQPARDSYYLWENTITWPDARCRICRKAAEPKKPIVQVECCGGHLCSTCYFDYFYRPTEYNKLSKTGNTLTGLMLGLLVVPALTERTNVVKGICRFQCPLCKTKTVYNYFDRKKTVGTKKS